MMDDALSTVVMKSFQAAIDPIGAAEKIFTHSKLEGLPQLEGLPKLESLSHGFFLLPVLASPRASKGDKIPTCRELLISIMHFDMIDDIVSALIGGSRSKAGPYRLTINRSIINNY